MARIVSVDIARVDYPLVGEFKFFKTQARPTIVLRLTDENGVEGFGQSVPIETWTYETIETVETTLRHYLAPVVPAPTQATSPASMRAWSAQSGRLSRSASRSPRRQSISPATICGAGRRRSR